jgi:hypothetical protein
MLFRLRDQMLRLKFAGACKGVFRTAPVAMDPSSDVVVLSQLQHKDVLMYLLALKSLAHRISTRAVYVVDDGTLTASDAALLREHIPGLVLLAASAFHSDACPVGGTWERLLAIATLVHDHYVVQLDSDTLTLGPIAEVRDCIAKQAAFVIGTWDNQKVESMRERSDTAKKLVDGLNGHVQVVAEANFDKLDDFASLRYVRGCSGFAGFARGSFAREFIEDISKQMSSAIGKKWSEWGSEQVMSNVVIANVANAVVLPHPKYADCQKMRPGATEFIHFIGSCRFNGGTYARLGADIISALSDPARVPMRPAPRPTLPA